MTPDQDRRGQQQHQAMIWAFPEYGGQLAIRAGRWKLHSSGSSATLTQMPAG